MAWRTTSSSSQFAARSSQKRLRADSCELRAAQEGFTLAGLIVILTIISIIIAFTVPEQWSKVLGRDRDKQTIFLMKQYARAIHTWRTKHSALPVSLDQIKDARKPRVIRGKGDWPCPLTGKEDDWILVPPGAALAGGGTVPMPTNPQPVNPATNPANPNQPPARQPTKLNPEASPKDYVGPFVGVRPNVKGQSFIAFNGVEDYGEWVYTVDDLQFEITARQAALSVK